MRDDFPQATATTLAKRVGYLCSRCRRSTVGPRDGATASVNVGVAAHITGAAPGGPRYDPSLTPDERRSVNNGIWLCQICAKLIDNDVERFSADSLRRLKQRAEERAMAALDPTSSLHEPGPQLHLPSGPATGLWLAYIAQSTTFCGRSEELAQLEAFLDDERSFLLWVAVAPAGSGKSRLALELCLNVAGIWNSGFLSRTSVFADWQSWEPSKPTLVVVDYVAGRAASISDIALQLSRSKMLVRENRVRLLLLEREVSSAWWPDFLREASLSEGLDIARAQYALPLRLGALSDDALWTVTTDVAALMGTQLHDSDREARLTEAQRVDPNGRPLFAMIAAAASQPEQARASRDSLLRTVLNREQGRWRAMIPSEHDRERMLNLATYVTVRGGISSSSGREIWPTAISTLLPDPAFFDDGRYRELVGHIPEADLRLPAFQPDVLGEFFVLERLKGSTGSQVATHAVLDTAWDEDPEAASQFVRRAAADFWNDPSAQLLQEPAIRTERQREVWAQMVADLVRFAPSSSDAHLAKNLNALRALADAHPDEARLRQHHARAEFNLGTLLLMEKAYSEADLQLSAAIDLPLVAPDTQANALNNRGIARWMYQSMDAAFDDFSRVLALAGASNEVRACAFNNRADILEARRDFDGAIVDRTNVLELSDTTYNRRYIARIRRCREFLQLGRVREALHDLDAILATEDIVLEQKMAARVKRARILRETDPREARRDLDRVIASPLNFNGVVSEALVLRGEMFVAEDLGKAIEDFNAALRRHDIAEEDVLRASMGLGVAFGEVGEVALAREALAAVSTHPNVSDAIRKQAQQMGEALGEQ